MGTAVLARSIVVAALSLGLVHGCSERVCVPPSAVPMLEVIVRRPTGEPLCDAAVVVLAGTYTESGKTSGTDGSCRYYGAVGRLGQYTITVSFPGFASKTVGPIATGGDQCAPVMARADITLGA